jgi:hypothetical protein
MAAVAAWERDGLRRAGMGSGGGGGGFGESLQGRRSSKPPTRGSSAMPHLHSLVVVERERGDLNSSVRGQGLELRRLASVLKLG